MQFTHAEHHILQELNKMLTEGWEIVDARVSQWSHVERELGKPIGVPQAAGYSFILGKPAA